MISTETNPSITELADYALEKLYLPESPNLLYDPFRYTLQMGGKRLRFSFALIGCGLCKGNPEKAIPAATAIELLHNFTLTHDDVMDGAETRRGQVSVHKKWNTPIAILSGDMMFVKALEQLQKYEDNEQYRRIVDIFLTCTREVCEGQAMDLEFEYEKEVSLEEYLCMTRGKTASLIKGSLLMGGTVADGNNMQLNCLSELGLEIGVAFQIQDDLLDVTGDPEKFGKRQGGDIYEGKKTYLSILALRRGDNKQKEFINSVLSSNNVTENEVQKVIEIYDDLEIFNYCRTTINRHYNNALKCLDMFPITPYRNQLSEILYNMINREY